MVQYLFNIVYVIGCVAVFWMNVYIVYINSGIQSSGCGSFP